MRNTGTEYGSDERKPAILLEFSELLPPLTEEQLSALERDLLANSRLGIWLRQKCIPV